MVLSAERLQGGGGDLLPRHVPIIARTTRPAVGRVRIFVGAGIEQREIGVCSASRRWVLDVRRGPAASKSKATCADEGYVSDVN